MRREIHHNLGQVEFLGEQDGESEMLLKARLVKRFRSSATLIEAFLVNVEYDGGSEFHVALCLKVDGSIPDLDLLKAAQQEFAGLFNNTQSMDVLFLNPVQHEQIVTVARPFYRRSSPNPA